MTIRRSLVAGLGVAALAAPLLAPGAATAAPPAIPAVQKATAYLLTQQQADGGFETAGFTGFETSDAILALAESSQGPALWDTAAANAYLTGLNTSGGKDPLDAIDDLVDGDAGTPTIAIAARAAKVITLVANPLGLDAHDLDPSGDSESAVDLWARIGAFEDVDGSYELGAQFNGVLYIATALAGAGEEVPAGLVAQIRAAQNDDGSWSYDGAPVAVGTDVDTTSQALLALDAAGQDRTDADVAQGIAWLDAGQQANGAWQAFGSNDPNSTSAAAVALSALQVDVTAAPFASPYPFLAAQQGADGRIASPADSFGINTLPTSQTTQALARQWYLRPEHKRLSDALSAELGSPKANESFAASQVASDAIGFNASIGTARSRAAKAVLDSSFGREAAAADLFAQALDRELDPSGRAYWSNKLKTLSRPGMLSQLTGSSEFYNVAGGTIPSFVDAVYQSVLGRAPDASGRAFWINRLTKGESVRHVASSLVASSEFRRNQVDEAYDRVLGRPADAAGRAYWTNKLSSTRIEVLLRTLAATGEFYDRAQTLSN